MNRSQPTPRLSPGLSSGGRSRSRATGTWPADEGQLWRKARSRKWTLPIMWPRPILLNFQIRSLQTAKFEEAGDGHVDV